MRAVEENAKASQAEYAEGLQKLDVTRKAQMDMFESFQMVTGLQQLRLIWAGMLKGQLGGLVMVWKIHVAEALLQEAHRMEETETQTVFGRLLEDATRMDVAKDREVERLTAEYKRVLGEHKKDKQAWAAAEKKHGQVIRNVNQRHARNTEVKKASKRVVGLRSMKRIWGRALNVAVSQVVWRWRGKVNGMKDELERGYYQQNAEAEIHKLDNRLLAAQKEIDRKEIELQQLRKLLSSSRTEISRDWAMHPDAPHTHIEGSDYYAVEIPTKEQGIDRPAAPCCGRNSSAGPMFTLGGFFGLE